MTGRSPPGTTYPTQLGNVSEKSILSRHVNTSKYNKMHNCINKKKEHNNTAEITSPSSSSVSSQILLS